MVERKLLTKGHSSFKNVATHKIDHRPKADPKIGQVERKEFYERRCQQERAEAGRILQLSLSTEAAAMPLISGRVSGIYKEESNAIDDC
jgi:uncharacterized protein YgiB involved in biofilm formation